MTDNNLEILKRSRDLMIEIHKMTELLSRIPIFGEAGLSNQPVSRNSSKKRYSYEFIKNLVSDLNASQYHNHLETLFKKGRLTPENLYAALRNKFERLCGILHGFNQSQENQAVSQQ